MKIIALYRYLRSVLQHETIDYRTEHRIINNKRSDCDQIR